MTPGMSVSLLTRLIVSSISNKNSLFEIEVRDNLRLCTITGDPTVILIIIQASWIKIPYRCFIVKTGFWAQEAGLSQVSPLDAPA